MPDFTWRPHVQGVSRSPGSEAATAGAEHAHAAVDHHRLPRDVTCAGAGRGRQIRSAKPCGEPLRCGGITRKPTFPVIVAPQAQWVAATLLVDDLSVVTISGGRLGGGAVRWPGQARVSWHQRLLRSPAGRVRDQGEQGGTREGELSALAPEIEALGRRVKPGDVADTDAAAAMAEATIRDLGQLGILVDNAAGAARSRSRTDLAGTTSGVRRDHAHKRSWRVGDERRDDPPPARPRRAAPGRIVNIASVAGRVDYPARSAYCASKFAVIG